MCSFDAILVILKNKNLTQRNLSDYLGVGETAVAAWKAGRSEGWRKRLPEIAEFLGVTVDELLTGSSSNTVPFEPGVAELNALILALDRDDRLTLRRMAEAMLAADKYKKDARPDVL